ncbi:MAG: cellulase family glycosylhydrolase [Verrucomicrobia bacterium]|nr:cellulase family glycosylhydrolase [Verrucomicrobiota bacterium]
MRKGRFYLDGQPFAEISFNKFDLFWQLYDQLGAGKALSADNPMVQAQDRALRELHEMGFRTIRIFALPWGDRGPESYVDPQKRKLLYEALDKTLDLCDTHDIRVVWSLAAGTFTDTKRVPGKGWVHGKEHKRELMSDPESRGRQLLYRYIDETVARYKHRKAVLMWEVGNETTLSADIGSGDRIYKGERMPTLKNVAGFIDDVAKRIKATDPLRLVNSGGSHMREAQWNLYQRRSWKKDTFEEQFECFDLLYAKTAVDVIDVHSYMNNRPGYIISDGAGGETFLDNRGWMQIAKRIGKPLMIGELGLHASPKSDRKVWDKTPNYFERYSDTASAKPWVEKTLNSVVDAGVQMSYWWCYQSDRPMDQNKPQRFDLTRERNPVLLKSIVEANQRLKSKLGIEPARKGNRTRRVVLHGSV